MTETIVNIAHTIFLAFLGGALVCALYRLLKGPTIADRVNAADVVALCCIGFAIGQGWRAADAIWLDVALVAGLVLFVGTTAVSLYLPGGNLSKSDS